MKLDSEGGCAYMGAAYMGGICSFYSIFRYSVYVTYVHYTYATYTVHVRNISSMTHVTWFMCIHICLGSKPIKNMGSKAWNVECWS